MADPQVIFRLPLGMKLKFDFVSFRARMEWGMGSRVLEKKTSEHEEKNHLTRTTIASTLGIELAYWWEDEWFCASLIMISVFCKKLFAVRYRDQTLTFPPPGSFKKMRFFGSVDTHRHKHTRYKNYLFLLTCLYCADEIKMMITVPFLQFSFWIYSYTISLTCQIIELIMQVIVITNLRVSDPNTAWVFLGFSVQTNPRAFSLR